MRVLITGGAGFIGSHLCDAFVSKGNDVTILDNLSTGSESNIAHLKGIIKVNQGDIRNKDLVEKLISGSDLVLHMAAALGVNNILNNPIDSISTNFFGSEIVLNAANKFDKRIVIASTSEIYGKSKDQPINEGSDRIIGTPQKLRWTYSDAKALEEAMAHALFLTQGLKVTTLRFFNTVGPRQTGKYGMVIPRLIGSAVRNEPLEVFGSGLQTRVFCHVLDAVQAVISILEVQNTIGEVFNVGGKGEISILDLARLIKEITYSKSSIVNIDYQNAYPTGYEDMMRRVPDISKIKEFTGWEPKILLKDLITDIVSTQN
jgi:UDP-glucose 4-epimerase